MKPGIVSGVYEIVCKANGHRYIGSSNNVRVRWRAHRVRLTKGNHHAIPLQRAWEKYGKAAFLFNLLEEVADLAQLAAREQWHIDTLKPEYNMVLNAGTNAGWTPTEASREKMRRAAKARGVSQAALDAAAAANKGKSRSQAVRDKISATKLAQKQKRSDLTERNATKEYRQKVSATHKAKGYIPWAAIDAAAKAKRERRKPPEGKSLWDE